MTYNNCFAELHAHERQDILVTVAELTCIPNIGKAGKNSASSQCNQRVDPPDNSIRLLWNAAIYYYKSQCFH